MKIIGLTGGIACGKSTVSAYLKSRGAVIVDGDGIARELSNPHAPIWNVYVEHFGKKILNADNTLNRRLIGQIVFTDEQEKRWMNETLQPIIKQTILDEIAACRQKGIKVLVLDIPLLYEAGWHVLADEVWVVKIAQDLQVQRIIERDGLTEKEAVSRIKAQMPLAEKIRRADVIIDTSTPIEITRQKVERICRLRNLELDD